MARYAGDWIDGFMDFTSHLPSPAIFRKWTAISIIAAAMERKTWVILNGRQRYPNMFILLVAPPGVGKTEAIRSVYEFTAELKELHLAPDDVSSASLIDALAKAERKVMRPTENPPMVSFNCMAVASDELGVFLKMYDAPFMSKLNKLFDGTPFHESKRSTKVDLKIEKPLLNFFAGTTPAWLGGSLPPTAWAEGFSSRLIMIYSGEKVWTNPFAEVLSSTIQFEKLVKDLQVIHSLYGQFRWADDVVPLYLDWGQKQMPPIPEHPKLESYLPRRLAHFTKVLMVCSAARGNDMIITKADYQTAQDILLEAESIMPDVFKSMSMSVDSNILDETYAFVFNAYNREGQKPIAHHRIIHFIQQRAPIEKVLRTLDTLLQSNMLAIAERMPTGQHKYKPTSRAEHGQ